MKYHAVCSVMTVAAQIILMSVPKKKKRIYFEFLSCVLILHKNWTCLSAIVVFRSVAALFTSQYDICFSRHLGRIL